MSSGLQNRVAPTGAIVTSPFRGTRMGNRGGKMHVDKTLRRQWATKQWIYCVLNFKDRHREVMGDSYTELFFLDEVTALSAGHRPCFECQHTRAMEFAHTFPADGRSRAPYMDDILHAQRRNRNEFCAIDKLPDGSFVEIDNAPFLLHTGRLFPWSMEGYSAPVKARDQDVRTLTPPATRSTFLAGYMPEYHPTLARLL